MSQLDSPACTACGKTSDQLPAGAAKRMLVCSRCQSDAARLVHYCSRDCQVSHFREHKPICGLKLRVLPESRSPVVDPSAPFQPPPALLFQLAALTTLPPSASPTTPPPSFLYFPFSPVGASSSSDVPMPVPISLPEATRNLFNALSVVAFRSGNPLSVNLMFSLLITEVEALGGVEARLIEQLSEEYRLDGVQEVGGVKRKALKDILEEEDEPTPQELVEAIGGEGNMGMLLEWQMSEAAKSQAPQ
ncbi:zinc finger MYND domain-containing protein [Rhodotorula paludigena]|uniref:zinc finger MYND domain-containing protein n=1 Tax=Rhodotorula paludigena TaxID=86838 RepID=UPI00317042AF